MENGNSRCKQKTEHCKKQWKVEKNQLLSIVFYDKV